MLSIATKILRDYGRVLGQLEPGSYGLPEASLPHSKLSIREATKAAIKAVGPERPEIREALIRGYVYLAQFVPEPDVALLLCVRAPNEPGFDLKQNLDALKIVNRIKLDMAQALGEIQALAA